MRLQVLSDLHLEFLRVPEEFSLPKVDADVTILAGDIHTHTHGLTWAAEAILAQGRRVIYVPGNHEYYHDDLSDLPSQLRKAALQQGIHLLDNSAVVLDGVRFLGSTLWTDFALHGPETADQSMQAARQLMNDFRYICATGGEDFTPEQSVALHCSARKWLEEQLTVPFEGPTVVITHHAPHPGSIHARFVGSDLSPAFASDLTAVIDRYRPVLWIHGHMHDAFDYTVGATRVVCNPKGYPGERQHGQLEFDPAYVLTV